MNLYQLVGNDGVNIALLDVPTNGIDVQEVINEAFDEATDEEYDDDDYDDIFDRVIEILENEHKIKRVYVEEVYTDKL